MNHSIINPELHRQLFGKDLLEYQKEKSKSFSPLPTIYWYLCAGDDYPRITQVCELAEANNLHKPNLFVLTDNHYLLSKDGKVNVGENAPDENRARHFRDNFHHVRSYSELPGFEYSKEPNWDSDYYINNPHSFLNIYKPKDEYFSHFFNEKSDAEIKIQELKEKGFSDEEIELIWKCSCSEEEIIEARKDPEKFKEFATENRVLADLCINDQLDRERELDSYNHLKSILKEKRQIASLFKQNTREVFVLLLAVDNIDYARSTLGQKTYAIIGTSNWGHDPVVETAAAGNYHVLFQLSVAAAIQTHRDDILVIDTPYEIDN